MDLGIAGKRAAVAAASSGLGLATAQVLAAEGAHVVMCSRTAERIEPAARAVGHGALPLVADVGTPEGAADFVDQAAAALGGIDILVTNGGGPPPGNFASTDLDAYRTALDANLLAVVAMVQGAVPGMRAQGWGRVVAITSASVKAPIGTLILSNTARTGVTSFLKTVATEVAADGVTVNSVLPGLHLTERLSQLSRSPETLAEQVPARALGRPEDFGATVAYLCSDQARFITGVAVHVDGGSYQGLF